MSSVEGTLQRMAFTEDHVYVVYVVYVVHDVCMCKMKDKFVRRPLSSDEESSKERGEDSTQVRGRVPGGQMEIWTDGRWTIVT